jgi:hypothetical protein
MPALRMRHHGRPTATRQGHRPSNEGTTGDPEDGTTFTIVTIRRLIACCALSVASTGCGAPPVEIRGQFEPADGAAVDIRIAVQSEHRRDASKYLRGAVASLATLRPWLGAYPDAMLTIVDPPWHAASLSASSVVTLPRSPWWSLPTAMAPELAAARGVALRNWETALDGRALPPWFTAGIVEYSARRAVAPLFQGDNLPPGYAMLEPRYFHAFVPWFVRIRLMAESDGDPLPAYRANPRANVASPSGEAELASLTAKTVLTLNTLERWVSRPAFDGVLAEFVRASRATQPVLADFTRVASSATGQDLSWLFEQTLGKSVVFDYAVGDLTSVPNPGGGFDTTVVAERLGEGVFSGSSALRVGPFDSGRGLAVRIAFEDGQQIVNTWDGRDARRTFRYHSVSPARSATIDPDRVLVLDTNRTNNSWTLEPRSSVAASLWALRWMLWLEHALLNYSVFV